MKAICKTKAAPGAQYIDIDIPRIKSDELLIKIHATSICGSDLPIYTYSSWSAARMPIPFVFGHEMCGEVVEIGDKAVQVVVGVELDGGGAVAGVELRLGLAGELHDP